MTPASSSTLSALSIKAPSTNTRPPGSAKALATLLCSTSACTGMLQARPAAASVATSFLQRRRARGLRTEPFAEQDFHLVRRRIAEPLFEGERHERRDPVGGERRPENRNERDRNRGGERPEDDRADATNAQAKIAEAWAAALDRRREALVADVETREFRRADGT